jgi:hypothetical protein
MPAHAASISVASTTSRPYHDMSHPAKVTLPCAGEPRSGVSGQRVITCDMGKSKAGVLPNVGSPIGQCVNGIGYRQTENGATSWTNTQQGVTTYVEYWWCPATNSSKYPSGINWSFGKTWPTSGCFSLHVGYWVGQGSTNAFYLGAVLWGTQPNTTDGEADTSYYICSGNYVWDYSLPGDGQYAWKARMSTGQPVYNNLYLSPYSEVDAPNFQ